MSCPSLYHILFVFLWRHRVSVKFLPIDCSRNRIRSTHRNARLLNCSVIAPTADANSPLGLRIARHKIVGFVHIICFAKTSLSNRRGRSSKKSLLWLFCLNLLSIHDSLSPHSHLMEMMFYFSDCKAHDCLDWRSLRVDRLKLRVLWLNIVGNVYPKSLPQRLYPLSNRKPTLISNE